MVDASTTVTVSVISGTGQNLPECEMDALLLGRTKVSFHIVNNNNRVQWDWYRFLTILPFLMTYSQDATFAGSQLHGKSTEFRTPLSVV